MNDQPIAPPARPTQSPKRQAILSGARRVFGRDGYTRASIDTIATAAGVSTRTLYNHFGGKRQLFGELIVESAAEVRDAQLAEIERHIGKIEDLGADLKALGFAFAATPATFAAHFALVRQIQAEAEHLPGEILEAWRHTGPSAVHAALARALARLAERGLLAIEDADRAASQFVALVATEVNQRTLGGALPLAPGVIEAIVEDGVTTFLRAFGTAASTAP